LPKTVTRQRRDCDLNPGPSAPESGTLTTRLPSHPRIKAALSTARAARARAARLSRCANPIYRRAVSNDIGAAGVSFRYR